MGCKFKLEKPVNEDIAPELVGKVLHKDYNASAIFFVKEKIELKSKFERE
ncbi:hypothetical protein [Campylobacter sp. RM16192]|nr:hypothetical protein [Campylobacter sp. RM16192]